jgi:hypothetical protein
MLPAAFGSSIPAEYEGYPIIGGIKVSEWNGFHDFVFWDELFRAGAIASAFIGLVSSRVSSASDIFSTSTVGLTRLFRPLELRH